MKNIWKGLKIIGQWIGTAILYFLFFCAVMLYWIGEHFFDFFLPILFVVIVVSFAVAVGYLLTHYDHWRDY